MSDPKKKQKNKTNKNKINKNLKKNPQKPEAHGPQRSHEHSLLHREQKDDLNLQCVAEGY